VLIGVDATVVIGEKLHDRAFLRPGRLTDV